MRDGEVKKMVKEGRFYRWREVEVIGGFNGWRNEEDEYVRKWCHGEDGGLIIDGLWGRQRNEESEGVYLCFTVPNTGDPHRSW
ncbi:hypothetical protein HAX54_019160 [Datura stramonium]|uniref:Uncharacterized protein n=1 Tax=Datura stramonium TaxID=4076 RepID=A0ABS8UPQ6_DATST|nr:hypothetical protein [Datura stramonium]